MLKTFEILILTAGGGQVDDDVHAGLFAFFTGDFHSVREFLQAHGLIADLHFAVHHFIFAHMDVGDGGAGLCAFYDLVCKLFRCIGHGGCLCLLGAGSAETDLNHYFICFCHN